ncbi:MAG: hypothetical protein KAI53_03035, partial [Candidatus Aenigmarchaeota archaeon]|nr:hypothetical protein [Candidatus Aenigmarchaeota archaeon]
MKKNIALLSIWILIFATYGPVANVSADDPLGKCGAELCGKWWLFETCAPDEMCVEKLGTYGCEEKVECLDSDKRISDIGASENHIRCFDPVRGVIPESEKTEQSVCVACTFEEPPETIKCCRFGIMNPQYFWSTEDCPITVVLDPCWETDNKECAAKSWNDYPGGVECRVINFNLPQKDKAAMSTVAKAKEWISGMGDP